MTAAGSLPSHSSPSSLILPLVDSSSGLARHVSKPLDHLMNSGQTRESKHHTAVLEDEDVETFVAFCEYAYTGDYSVPPPGARQDDREPVSPVTRPAFQRCFTAESVLSPSDHAYLPSPPRSAEAEKDSDRHVAVDEVRSREEPKAVGGEDVKGNGISHESAALEESRTGEAPVSEERGGQLATDAPDGDVEPWEMAGDAAPSKGKKGKKKDKKKQKEDMQVDDLNTKLTPPTTPPPDNLRDGEARDDTPERDERANEESPFESAAEQAATSPSQGMEDGWEESPGSTTPSGNDTTTPDPETADQGEEDGNQEVERSMGPIIDTSFAKQHFSHHEKGTSMWDEFASLNYIDPRGYSSTRPPSVLSTQSSRAELPYLVFHAKLYVFAARYLIPALAQLCLRKLHRDLVNLGFPDGDGPSDRNADDDEAASLTTTKAKMVLDLLHYTYTKTTRLEPISPAAATQLRDNELRKLVIHYAACKVRDLAECCPPMEGDFSSLRYPVKPSDRGMRALLDVTPELASDLVYRMM
ncbi:hypothetical protein BJX96DRAFT_166796 [Aspergillus floccosus]